MKNLTELVKSIGVALGPTSGLDSEEVNHDELISLMNQYKSDESEWSHYALPDLSRNYTRNLVDTTNDKSNILIVVWNPGKGSPIHDHANAHCIMKILKGSLRETLYSSPDEESNAPMPFKVTTYDENQVTYISDKIGLHKIENLSDTEPAVSLHLYTPPHAHNNGFNLFDEKSGKKFHIKSAALHSDHGKLCRDNAAAQISHERHMEVVN